MPDDTRIESIEIRPAERQLLVGGTSIALGARAFDLLVALYERCERVVSKNELFELVWPGLVVEENNLQVQVSTLRKALGPSAITTIPGRGYKFTLPASALKTPEGRYQRSPENPSQGRARPLTNLPATPPLYGRDADVAAAAALMQACAVVSIVGAGGIGKTRLALALAAADEGPAPEGRWWVELAAINEGAQVPATIAAALGVPLAGGRPPESALAFALASQRMLLVLDNCEHLAEAIAELVAALRADAPGVRLLITSQESLKCVDEQVYRLGSLAWPLSNDPDEASRYGAVALFVARARAADPRFRLGPDNVAAVVDICRRLDGIPLAIELAAARVPMLGVTGLQTRLDQMFNILTGVARMKLRRHQTLRAALEWSYGLLSEDERAVFRRLGVFSGGFTLELAQEVGHDERMDRWGVVDVLAQLIDKSLVIAEGEGEPRYRLLEPARAFALEQLAAAGESAPMLRRHAQAVAAAMDVADELQWTEPIERRLARMAEIGNLRAAVDWATSPSGDRALAYRLLGRGWFIWFGNNVAAEGFERMMQLWPLQETVDGAIEAAFCLGLASLRPVSANDEVLHAARRAVSLYRELGDDDRLADALCRLVVCGVARRQVPGTREAVEEAARLITASSPYRRQAALAKAEGGCALDAGDFEAAINAFQRQADCARRDGDTLGELFALNNIGMSMLDIGRVNEAVEVLTRCLQGLERIRAPYGAGAVRALLSVALAVRGGADVLTIARDAFEHLRLGGAGVTAKPLMAAALHHARQGDLPRALVVAGFARHVVIHEAGLFCPIDRRMQDDLIALIGATGKTVPVEAWMQAGERLDASHAAGIAFEAWPVADYLSRGTETCELVEEVTALAGASTPAPASAASRQPRLLQPLTDQESSR